MVLEFPSFEAALACYRSPEYQAAKKLRDGKADADVIVTEGYRRRAVLERERYCLVLLA